MNNLDLYAPVTQQPEAICAANNPKSRRLAVGGYVTYLRAPEQHTNVARSHAGKGVTPEESYTAACYWANQSPWAVTVPISKAPRWAVEEAVSAEVEEV